MNKKFYKQMDETIDSEIKKARSLRTKFYEIQKQRLQSRNMKYKGAVSFLNINDNNLSYNDEYSVFEHKSYNFVSFANTKWGSGTVLGEDDYIEVREKSFFYVDFINCEFRNIVFNGCHFVGCKFDSCVTGAGKVIFQNCSLRGFEMEYNGTIHENYSISTEFYNCKTLQIDIRNSLADSILFDRCSIMLSTIQDTEMPNTIFNGCGFHGVTIEDCKLNGVKIKDTINYELRFKGTVFDDDVNTDVYISKLSLKGYDINSINEYKQMKKLNPSETITEKEFIREKNSDVAKLFYTISNLLKTSNFNDDYTREYSYMYNKYLMKSKRDFGDRMALFFSWGLFGFGERMGRFVFWATSYMIIFTIIYMFTGIQDSSGKTIKYVINGGVQVPAKEVMGDFFQCMHFSIITFSTVGYGNITPYGWSLLVSAIQIISGVVLVALFTSVIVKKFLR